MLFLKLISKERQLKRLGENCKKNGSKAKEGLVSLS
jgi:hypothetical protein